MLRADLGHEALGDPGCHGVPKMRGILRRRVLGAGGQRSDQRAGRKERGWIPEADTADRRGWEFGTLNEQAGMADGAAEPVQVPTGGTDPFVAQARVLRPGFGGCSGEMIVGQVVCMGRRSCAEPDIAWQGTKALRDAPGRCGAQVQDVELGDEIGARPAERPGSRQDGPCSRKAPDDLARIQVAVDPFERFPERGDWHEGVGATSAVLGMMGVQDEGGVRRVCAHELGPPAGGFRIGRRHGGEGMDIRFPQPAERKKRAGWEEGGQGLEEQRGAGCDVVEDVGEEAGRKRLPDVAQEAPAQGVRRTAHRPVHAADRASPVTEWARPDSFGEIQPGACGSPDDPERDAGSRAGAVVGGSAEDPGRKVKPEQGAVGGRGSDRRAEGGERLPQHRGKGSEAVEVISGDVAVGPGFLAPGNVQDGTEGQVGFQCLDELDQDRPAGDGRIAGRLEEVERGPGGERAVVCSRQGAQERQGLCSGHGGAAA